MNAKFYLKFGPVYFCLPLLVDLIGLKIEYQEPLFVAQAKRKILLELSFLLN